MKIAFASKDGVYVNEHFGWCQKFYLYDINKEGIHDLGTADASLDYKDEIDKLDYKVGCLGKSNIVCVAQIGPNAANLLQSVGIYPLRSSNENETISLINNTLHSYLSDDHAPLWFKRIVYQQMHSMR